MACRPLRQLWEEMLTPVGQFLFLIQVGLYNYVVSIPLPHI